MLMNLMRCGLLLCHWYTAIPYHFTLLVWTLIVQMLIIIYYDNDDDGSDV